MEPQRWQRRFIAAVLRARGLVLLVAAAVTVLSLLIARDLRVDPDLRRLLPSDHPVLHALETYEQAFGGTGSVNVVVRGPTTARHAFTDAFEQAMLQFAWVGQVDARLPSDFFAQHALYYLSPADMNTLRHRIDAWLHYSFCSRAPDACVSPPETDAPANLRRFVEEKKAEAEQRIGFHHYYEKDGGETNVVFVRPLHSSSDLALAKQVTRDVQSVVEQLLGTPAWKDVSAHAVGPYVNKALENDVITRDIRRTAWFAAIGVVLVLGAIFRSARAVVLLLVPLGCGVVWSLALTTLVFGRLNAMTSMISAVVMGAGVDAGIHYFVLFRRERARGRGVNDALTAAFEQLVVPLFVAASTTVGAFVMMGATTFPAFREFGVIAALGVVTCVLAMLTVLPALTSFLGSRAPRASTHRHAFFQALLVVPRARLWSAGIITVLLGLAATRVQFEYNARVLQSDTTRNATEADVTRISTIIGHDVHGSALLVADMQTVVAVVAKAEAERAARGGATQVAKLWSLVDVMPPSSLDLKVRQGEVLGLLGEDREGLLHQLRKIAEGDQPRESNDALSAQDAALLLRMLHAHAFGVDDLPQSLRARLQGSDGSYAVFAYPAFDAADMRRGMAMMHETVAYLPEGVSGMFVGEGTVYAAMLALLQEKAPRVLALSAVFIVVLVWLQMRSTKMALVVLCPLALGMLWLFGLMGSVDIRLTLFNLPILPAILGIGVDNGVYLAARLRGLSRAEMADALAETGGAVLAATLTTAVGFGAFMLADSAGVRGIGVLAVMGIVTTAAAALVIVPAFAQLGWMQRRSR